MKGFGFRTLATILIVFHTMQAYGITLFKNGRSDYLIVVSPKASVSEKNAAKELQDYLKQIGGVNLPISHQAQTNGKHIYVGYNNYLKKMTGAPRPDADDEGFTYRTIGDNLCIWGGSERGTMYGVFTFLERELGVRWYAKDCTIIPPQKTVSLGILNHSEKPAVKYRYFLYSQVDDSDFSIKYFRQNVTSKYIPHTYGTLKRTWGVHTSEVLIPPKKYFKSHPEYFSLRNNQRIANGQLCLSNKQLLTTTIENLKAEIRKYPNYWCYDVSQNDNQLFCECNECHKIEQMYGGHSGIWIWFVNQIADAISEEFPNKYISTLAYQYTQHAPTNILPRKNILVRLCSIGCCFGHPINSTCKMNQPFINDLKTWSQLTDNLYIWDYVVDFSHYIMPWPNFNVLAPNIKTFIEHGSSVVFELGSYQTPGGEFDALKLYTISKLLWNPNQEVDSIAKEFIDVYYGKAAKYVYKYFALCQKLITPNIHLFINTHPNDILYSESFINESLNLLEKARKKAENEEIRRRVNLVYLQPLYLQLNRNLETAYRNGNFEKAMTIIQREKMNISEGTTAEQYLENMNFQQTQSLR